MQRRSDKKAIRRIWLTWILAIVLLISTLLAVLQLGAVYTMKSWQHWTPNYAKENLQPVLEKQTLTEEDYELLRRQTGLTKIGVDGLLESGNIGRIYALQELFFTPPELEITHYTAFTYVEYMRQSLTFANLEEGDIVLSATTYTSGFRHGHAALVVNDAYPLILESYAPGMSSGISSLQGSMGKMANVLVLRPKCDKAVRAEVARRAKAELVGLPFSITVGVLSPKFADELQATQCAHLVWYAYKKYANIDLDGNGGAVIKPQDIFLSDQVEVVQFYGFDPDRLWS
ncbi:MAG: hypothetical protein IJF39_02300 [Clostridia bacterium]|nr:hypothetical protein [Clostridia bacterium]